MIIRRFCEADSEQVSAMIIQTLKTSNSKDYSAEVISALEEQLQPSGVLERAGWTHFYVAEEGNHIIGCGAIGPYWGSETESSLFTIFVLHACQGKGVGRKIIETLEQDDFSSEQSASRFPRRSRLLIFTESLAMNTKTALTVLTRSGYTVWKSIDDLTPVTPRVALCAIC